MWWRESTEGAGRSDGQDDSRGSDDQDYILSKSLGALERRVQWLLLRAQVVGNIAWWRHYGSLLAF